MGWGGVEDGQRKEVLVRRGMAERAALTLLCSNFTPAVSIYRVTILPQLSLAALMADHVIGVYETKSFDIPMQIGG